MNGLAKAQRGMPWHRDLQQVGVLVLLRAFLKRLQLREAEVRGQCFTQ